MLYFVEVQVKDGKATYNVLQEKRKGILRPLMLKMVKFSKVHYGFGQEKKRYTNTLENAERLGIRSGKEELSLYKL